MNVSVYVQSVFLLLMQRAKIVAVASLFFALLTAVLFTVPERRIEMREDKIAASMGLTWQELRERVQTDLSALSTRPSEDIILLMEGLPLFAEPGSSEHIGLVYVLNMIPYLLGMFLIFCCTFLFALAFFFHLFADVSVTARQAASGIVPGFFQLIALSVWVSIRSFIWVPFFGFLIGLYTLPRLALSPAFLLQGKKGVLQAARESWKKTKRIWLQVFVRLLVLVLLLVPLIWIAAFPVSVAALYSLKLGTLLWLTVLMFLAAYAAAGGTMLTR